MSETLDAKASTNEVVPASGATFPVRVRQQLSKPCTQQISKSFLATAAVEPVI